MFTQAVLINKEIFFKMIKMENWRGALSVSVVQYEISSLFSMGFFHKDGFQSPWELGTMTYLQNTIFKANVDPRLRTNNNYYFSIIYAYYTRLRM